MKMYTIVIHRPKQSILIVLIKTVLSKLLNAKPLSSFKNKIFISISRIFDLTIHIHHVHSISISTNIYFKRYTITFRVESLTTHQ